MRLFEYRIFSNEWAKPSKRANNRVTVNNKKIERRFDPNNHNRFIFEVQFQNEIQRSLKQRLQKLSSKIAQAPHFPKCPQKKSFSSRYGTNFVLQKYKNNFNFYQFHLSIVKK